MLFASADVGPHLMAVEDLIQKHALQELQVTALGETKRKLLRQGQAQVQQQEALQQRLQQRLEVLDQAYDALQRASEERRARLEEARNFFQFLQDQVIIICVSITTSKFLMFLVFFFLGRWRSLVDWKTTDLSSWYFS